MTNPSTAVALFGTEEEVTPPQVLTAGSLSAELEAGNLRYIRWNGEEVLRAVSFIVRDKDWGTYSPTLSDLSVEEGDDYFLVTFRATAGDDDQSFDYEARIEGHADGRLVFAATGRTETGFLTNRTGFVVLHPIAGVAGEAAVIEHTDGTTVDGTFPEIIDPVQPMMDLRALTHTTPGGVEVRTLMEGDTYEMEDQRNWTDASYKTYVRPLALPWPYRIEPDETIDQAVTVTVSGTATSAAGDATPRIAPAAASERVPPLGFALRPEDIDKTRSVASRIAELEPRYLILHHDPREGHDRETLSAMLETAQGAGADAWLEAVIVKTDNAGAEAEIAALGEMAATLDHPFTTVLVSPAPDMNCTLPGSEWPETPDAAVVYDAARRAFPDARIGGGMFSYFTELNRKRPPTGKLDLVSFTTSPMVHAGDDRSVMESREAHGAIVKSVDGIAGDKPWAVGPSAIGMRSNPYGEAPKDNPRNIRQAMNWNDPRQRGLFGAVWALGYFGDFALGGAQSVALGAPSGPFGSIHTDADYPQPWYDEAGEGSLYPVFHVLRGLARMRGAPMRSLDLNAEGAIAGLAADSDAGTEVWIGNRFPREVEVVFDGPAKGAILDGETFADAASDPAFMDELRDLRSPLTLPAHAVARIILEC